MRQSGSSPLSSDPGHLVCLGCNLGEVEYWFSVYLDTKHGVVLVEQVDSKLCPDLGIPQCSDPAIVENEDYEVPETLYYDEEMEMHYEFYDIKPFFEACQQKLRSLEWCPSFRGRGLVQGEGALLDKKAMEERRNIIWDAGWPAETWNRDVARWMIRELDGERGLDAEGILN
ncbi:hypothetical protein PG985_007741 [Apiospora marii]|uniref:uncharacterized protein n=1 Tax=Apiospora marii TaxID=335849 RepID=UPI00313073A6